MNNHMQPPCRVCFQHTAVNQLVSTGAVLPQKIATNAGKVKSAKRKPLTPNFSQNHTMSAGEYKIVPQF
jgi:hypothetical protein